MDGASPKTCLMLEPHHMMRCPRGKDDVQKNTHYYINIYFKMKKFLFMAVALVVASAVFTSCKDEEEDGPKELTVTFEGEYFTKLIDNPQYKGALIYSGDPYVWTDVVTGLTSSCQKEDWSQWGPQYEGVFGWSNGVAISNYIDDDEAAGFQKQLSVPVSNGSSNFAIVWDNNSTLSFADGQAYEVKSMMVCPTTYSLRNVQKNCGEGYEFKVVATGEKADGSKSSVDIVLAKGTDVKTSWFTVDMSALGAVKNIVFIFDGTDMSSYGGLATPKYFALDNVVIVK